MTSSSDSPALVELVRGAHTTVESLHRGALVVVDDAGRTVLALGDARRATFPRSACKLLQALPLVASGAADALALTDAELALACASHNGEPGHVETAAAMLAKAGADETVLACGTHPVRLATTQRALWAAGREPGVLHHNCSGKHAGFVCVGCLMARAAGRRVDDFMRDYVEPDHPVMRTVTQALGAACGVDLRHVPRAVDGCSIPTFAMPLAALAHGWARAGTGVGLDADFAAAATRLRTAIARAPWHVAGTDRFDTDVMRRLGARVCCKVGAEAVYAAALPERGWGVALKVDDGQTPRAAEALMAAVIDAALDLDGADHEAIASRIDAPVTSMRGAEVGRLRVRRDVRHALDGLRALP